MNVKVSEERDEINEWSLENISDPSPTADLSRRKEQVQSRKHQTGDHDDEA
jgi:hypothetical protein